jgi:glycosyltransferase involved in cell wall biosynthesis
MNKIKVIVPSFNCPEYLRKNLASIESQSRAPDAVCVIDDGSTLPLQREIILDFCQRNKWIYRFHGQNYGALYSLVHGIEDFKCSDDDIIVIVDGDDWLAHQEVLAKVDSVYTANDLYLTWGQCEKYPPGIAPMKYASNVPDRVIENKLFREIPFVFRQPRTFKYILWRNIKDEDLRDENGEYFRIFSDKATLFPMLEMAGKKIKYIKDSLYIYNLENPLNDFSTHTEQEWNRVDNLIKNKPRYETLECCKL